MIREYYGPIQTSERILYTTPSFVSAKAVWTHGVGCFFDESVHVDGWLVVRSDTRTNIFQVKAVSESAFRYDQYDGNGVFVGDGMCGSSAALTTLKPSPRWSLAGVGEAYVYTDDFLQQPTNQLFSVAIVRSTTNGIIEVTNRLATLKFGKLPYEPIGN